MRKGPSHDANTCKCFKARSEQLADLQCNNNVDACMSQMHAHIYKRAQVCAHKNA